MIQHILGQRLHLHEPLLGKIRLHDAVRTLRMADLMRNVFNMIHDAALREILNQ